LQGERIASLPPATKSRHDEGTRFDLEFDEAFPVSDTAACNYLCDSLLFLKNTLAYGELIIIKNILR